MKTINIIGCGHVGKSLARLWTAHGIFQVQSILNRSRTSSRQAVDFVGGGEAIQDYAQLRPADVVMISVHDEAIEPCCRGLAGTETLGRGVVVFHCSGSLPSTLLKPAADRGASIASMHPVKSFAEPATAAETFAGTCCALEGDPPACALLRDALDRLGAIPFDVDPQQKTIYHAATVFVCNYLTALLEIGLRCFERAGVPRATAMNVMRPIVTETAENVFALGTVQALTGPIARGETSVVARQGEALGKWDEAIQQIYKSLGRVAVELSAEKGTAGREALAAIKESLQG